MYGELVALLRLLFCWTFPFCCDELLCPFSILVIGLTVVGSWCCCWCCCCRVKLFANMLWYDGRSVAASFASPLVVGIIAWYLLLFPLDKLLVCSWLFDEILLVDCNYSILYRYPWIKLFYCTIIVILTYLDCKAVWKCDEDVRLLVILAGSTLLWPPWGSPASIGFSSKLFSCSHFWGTRNNKWTIIDESGKGLHYINIYLIDIW